MYKNIYQKADKNIKGRWKWSVNGLSNSEDKSAMMVPPFLTKTLHTYPQVLQPTYAPHKTT